MNNQYEYTLNNWALTDQQRQFYEENGYIVIKKLIPDENLDKCYERFLQVANGDTTNVKIILKFSELQKNPALKGEYTINKIQDFMNDPTLFNNYIAHENMIKILSSIIGPNITAINAMLINKPPGLSYDYSKHIPHQDLHYFPFRPSNKVIGSWTAMEKVTEENGCLFVLPGSHKYNLLSHSYPENVKTQYYHGVRGFDDAPRVNVIMEKGDTLFFHSLLIHGSGTNFSKGFRKAISVHYVDSNCHVIDCKGTEQEHIEKEVLMYEKKTGKNFASLSEVLLKSRCKLVAGKPGNCQTALSRL